MSRRDLGISTGDEAERSGPSSVPASSCKRRVRKVWPIEVVGERKTLLGRSLRSSQIFSLVFSGVLGTGFLQNTTYALKVAGPGGLLLSFALVGVISIAVMECIGELTRVFPTPLSISEVVRTFVDEELGLVIGLCYCFSHTIIYVGLIISAIDLTDYWSTSFAVKSALWIVAPVLMVMINITPANIFGAFATLIGVIKGLFMAGILILMAVISSRKPGISSNITEGFQHDGSITSSQGTAVSVAMSLATYAFVGIEIVAVTPFEARNPSKGPRFASRYIAWLTSIFYLVFALFTALNVAWNDPGLSSYSTQALGGLVNMNGEARGPRSLAIIVMMHNAGWNSGPLNVFLILSVLSAANTSLYASSRTMFGMARRLDENSRWSIERVAAHIGFVDARTLTPWFAVVLTALAVFWLPFTSGSHDQSATHLQQTLLDIGTVSCILVWASQCLAYIRLHHYLKIHKSEMHGDFYAKYRSRSTLGSLQPAVAYFGLFSCLALIIVFNGAAMWNGEAIGLKFSGAYVAPLAAILIWIYLKLSRRSYRLHPSFGDLRKWIQFNKTLLYLSDLVYPTDYPVSHESTQVPHSTNIFHMITIPESSYQTTTVGANSLYDIPTRFPADPESSSASPLWRDSDEMTRAGDSEEVAKSRRFMHHRLDLPEIVIERPESEAGSSRI
jgi:amino acid transporter